MSGASPARRAAARIIHETVRGGVTLAERMAHGEAASLDTRERDFLQELVYGTLRRRGALDAALRRCIDRELSEVDPALLDVLRLGAYQILHTRVPHRAAVFESVALAREVAPRGAGFANAVLRRLAAEPPPAPHVPLEDPLSWLTGEGSLPPWLAQRWLQELGAEDAVARARVFLEPSPTYLRLNPRLPEAADAVSAAGVLLQAGEVPGSFVVTGGRTQDLAAAGVVYVQDEGSQLVAHIAQSEDGAILDACAAPGGKATLLADLGAHARITALEPSLKRLAVLQRTVQRWGAGASIAVLGGDALRLPLRTAFDVVLLDAPCTGLGTIARRPDLRWRVTQADVDRHAASQRRMLAAVSAVVKPGGRLVYSTCSLEPDETSDVVKSFLASGAPFALTPPQHVPQSLRGAEPWLRLLPERRGGDGFFVASFTRQG